MRKRILFCLAALLFTAGAYAQPWTSAVSTKPGYPNLKGDTVFVCLPRTAPFDLGYDVLSAYMSQTNGEWSMIYPASSSAYTPGSNIFTVDGTPAGTYIFQYKVTETTCSLNVGDLLFAYVVLVPDMSNVSVDTIICKGKTVTYATAADVRVHFSPALQEFLTYWGTGLNVTHPNPWASIVFSPTAADDHKTDVSAFKYDSVKFSWTAPISSYKCATNFKASIKVSIVDSIVISSPDTVLICKDDLLPMLPATPGSYFGIPVDPNGGTGWAANPSSILVGGKINFPAMSETGGKSSGPHYDFTFNFKNCGGTSRTVLRVIKIINGPKNANLGNDTLVFCKQKPYDSIKLHEQFKYPSLNPYATSITWKYIGNTLLPNGLGNGSGAASPLVPLAGGITTPTPIDTYTANYHVAKELMGTGVPYYFRFKLGNTASCMAGDSGIVMITATLPTGGVPVDYRVQICKKDGQPFNMNNYLSLGTTTTWTNVAPASAPPTVTGGTFAVADQDLGTYVFHYNEPSTNGCGGARSGDVTVKVTDNLVYSSSVSIYYCITTLPQTVNMFDLLGIAPVTGSSLPGQVGWVNSHSVNVPGNVLTMADIAVLGAGTYTFTYTPDAALSQCVSAPLTVTIVLGTTLP